MAFKGVYVFGFLLFLSFCNVTIKGRELAKQTDTLTMVRGENSSLYEAKWRTHSAGYYADGHWHGVRPRINAWRISDVQPKSYSAAYIVARNQGEMIAAGIHVYPDLYQNNRLHFFTYWMSDDSMSRTGCYNTRCNGFVRAVGANTYPGQAFAPPFSTYGGAQKIVTLRIKKDEQTGDWSLYREDQGGPIGGMTLLGWWPKTLFKGLYESTSRIEWKGEVSYHFNEKSPPMGSGHHAEGYEAKAAFFQNILAFSSNGHRFDPKNHDVSPDVDRYYCYDVSPWFKGKHDGMHFFYGGPSGCSDITNE